MPDLLLDRLHSEAVNYSATCGGLFDEAIERIETLSSHISHLEAHRDDLTTRVGVLDLALRTAARRFNMMGGSFVNGIDPITAYHECLAALAPERDK